MAATSANPSSKVVMRAARAVPRSPDAPTKMKIPGYSGYIPGAQNTIEHNYFQVTRDCFNNHADKVSHYGEVPKNQPFSANIKPRTACAPSGGGAKFLPGYGGFIPGQRFKFETSEGTLAKTWAPRRPMTESLGDNYGQYYQSAKPRPKLRNDKYIVGYTGSLPGYQNQIEQSYSRIARGVETGVYTPKPITAPAVEVNSQPNYMHKIMPSAPPEYKLPGYTGYIPRQKYTFEQRYSASVDAAKEGIVGGAGFRFGGGSHLRAS